MRVIRLGALLWLREYPTQPVTSQVYQVYLAIQESWKPAYISSNSPAVPWERGPNLATMRTQTGQKLRKNYMSNAFHICLSRAARRTTKRLFSYNDYYTPKRQRLMRTTTSGWLLVGPEPIRWV
jgi:hypothetical protein